MSAPPYMRLYWGDYHRDTRHLSRSEHGAYFMLLSALWNNGGKLPLEDAILAKHAMCSPKEWAEMKPTMMAFFKVMRGRLTHKRVTEELAKYEDTVRKRKAAGKKGGSARGGKDTENGEANAQQNGAYPEPEPEPVEGSNDPSLSAGKPERASPKAKTPIENGFPGEPEIDQAVEIISAAGVVLDAADHAKRFRGHALAQDRRAADWRAAWRSWIEIEIGKAPAAPVAAPPLPSAWNGPADLAADIRKEMGAEQAASYLNRCTWQEVPVRAVVAPTAFVADALTAGAPEALAAHGAQIIVAGRAVA